MTKDIWVSEEADGMLDAESMLPEQSQKENANTEADTLQHEFMRVVFNLNDSEKLNLFILNGFTISQTELSLTGLISSSFVFGAPKLIGATLSGLFYMDGDKQEQLFPCINIDKYKLATISAHGVRQTGLSNVELMFKYFG
jgi:hypothetical protein